ncbi:histidine kinase dimerization/phospho-acceptor domain-containing protein [Crenalkalicoccus roseus]|uniref:histidine kinase dimerization/phospho-acceptor domain-containing protein n=1 Tax=Crenalkalicoccus roseus TaxID=1485588 RepID=UPI0010805E85|nr:histidine kinase dimerization/phospho-acceptor domain-containing protein [Crenalkalicoccus roseus]
MDDDRAILRRRAERMVRLATLARPVQHDINNLLTVIFANLEMLRRSASEGAPQRQLDRIQEAARRFEATSRALLSLARRPVPGEGEVTLTEAVAALRPLLQVLLPTPGALEVEDEPDAWPVLIDRALLDDALLRLAAEVADTRARGLQLGLAVANRPGKEPRAGMAELTLRLRVTPSQAAREALGALARQGGGTVEEVEVPEGAMLRLLLPRHEPLPSGP